MSKTFKDEVKSMSGGANVLNCFLCGTCTATCPVSEIDGGYNPRKILRMVLLDKKDDILSSPELWKCNQCHACVAHCPQDVRFADVVRSLRGLAVKAGVKDKAFCEKLEAIDLETKKERLSKINALIASEYL